MIKPLINYKRNFNINFFSVRKIALVLSLFLIFFSFFTFTKKNLNLGIDFIGGIMIDAKFENSPDLNLLRNDIGSLSLGNFEIQEFGTSDNILIKLEKQEGDEDAQQLAIEKIKNILPPNVDYRRIEYVGPKVGKELQLMGLKAIIFSSE